MAGRTGHNLLVCAESVKVGHFRGEFTRSPFVSLAVALSAGPSGLGESVWRQVTSSCIADRTALGLQMGAKETKMKVSTVSWWPQWAGSYRVRWLLKADRSFRLVGRRRLELLLSVGSAAAAAAASSSLSGFRWCDQNLWPVFCLNSCMSACWLAGEHV